MGAILEILPRCIDMKEDNGDIGKEVYASQLGAIIGEGTYD